MTFSSTEVALEGFRLIRRRPVSALVWALAWILLGYGALWALLTMATPQLFHEAAALPDLRTQPRAAFAGIIQLELGLFRSLGPWLLWAWIVGTVLVAGVYRAVIEPRNNGFAYLRLGGDELRLLLLSIILGVLWAVFLFASIAAGAGLFMATSQLVQPAQGLLDVAIVLVLVCLALIIPVRLSLAGPMTFARKRLQILDSWGLTRGRFWRLVGLYVLVTVFIWVVAMVLSAVREVLTAGPMQGVMVEMYQHPGDPGRMFVRMLQTMSKLRSNPLLIAALAVQGVADSVIRVVAAAPVAAAYRALAGDGQGAH